MATITLAKRLNVILAISMIFLLILVTNRIDIKYSRDIQHYIKEVYNDRIKVQGYIFSISTILSSKRLALISKQIKQRSAEENERIDLLLSHFEATKLTVEEKKYFESLQVNFDKLIELEVMSSPLKENQELLRNKISKTLGLMDTALLKLSEIQIQESKELTNDAHKSLSMSATISNLEIGFIIIIGIAIQFILFYKIKKAPRSDYFEKNHLKN
ncbi:hypothetical protein [Flavimarina sp. Hel_I_48]|uniref:hypothetical protein n=1 Tax=Flavimarina sp. Hel_I_48 TaxID=1392488 RepID=UPI0004DF34E4|nr:hypothetical protein [Flavimarina sp. Hel_I_48]